MNAFPRRVSIAMSLAMLVLLAGGAWFYRTQEKHLRLQTEKDLQAIAQLKADQVANWRADQLAEAGEITNSLFFTKGAARWLAIPRSEGETEIRSRFRSLEEHYHYRDIMLVDPAGTIHLSQSNHPDPFHAEEVQALANAFRTRKPFITDLHLSTPDAAPHLSLVAPLFGGSGNMTIPVAAVVLRIDANDSLYPLIQSWPVPSRTAETLLIRKDGDSVLFLNELRHRKDSALKTRIPLTKKDAPAVMAVMGRKGITRGRDYRDVDVLAVLKPIPGSSWILVTKIDASEAFEIGNYLSVLILSSLLGLVAAGIATVGVVWQRNQKAHYRALVQTEEARRKTEERHRITLMSVGDGVIATDALGRIDLTNPVAETLTGWAQDEARGKSLEEVFHIVNEDSRLPVENPVRLVMQKGTVVGLANHTLLISRDGTERAIADSGAPIRNEKDEITGVVLVFRDQTEERNAGKALYDSEERYRGLFDHMSEGLAYCEVVFENGQAIDFAYISVNKAFETLTGLKDVTGKRVSEVIPGIREADPKLFEIYGRVASTGNPEKFEIHVSALKQWFSISVYCPKRGFFIAVFDVITDRKRAEEEHQKLEAQFRQAQKMEAVGRLAGGVAHDFNNILQTILGYAFIAYNNTPPESHLREYLQEIQKAGNRAADLTGQLLAFARQQTISPKVLNLNDTVSSMLKMLQRLIGEDIDLSWQPAHEVRNVKIDPSQLDQLLANLAVNARDAIAGVGKVTIETSSVFFDASYCADHPGFVPGEYVMLAVSDDGCGMDKETQNRIFEPFFTTKGVGEGTGLGLATVYGIVKQNRGFINVYSEPGTGTTFKIYLPRVEATPEEIFGGPPTKVRGGAETVLLVEDDESILKLGKTFLEQLGYTVLPSRTPREAIRLAHEHTGDIQLLITDVVMPEMNGRELSEQIRAIRPGTRCLYMSGYTADVIAHRGILIEGVHFLQKPFSAQALADKVREALES